MKNKDFGDTRNSISKLNWTNAISLDTMGKRFGERRLNKPQITDLLIDFRVSLRLIFKMLFFYLRHQVYKRVLLCYFIKSVHWIQKLLRLITLNTYFILVLYTRIKRRVAFFVQKNRYPLILAGITDAARTQYVM